MANTIKIKRGTNAARLSYIPSPGEPVFALDTKRLYIGDGVTAGGLDPLSHLGSASLKNAGTGAGELPILDASALVPLTHIPNIPLALLPTGITANKIPVIGADNKLPASIIPSIAISDVFPVATIAEMLALTAERGDTAIVTEKSSTYILKAEPASLQSNWVALTSPIDGIQSINGLTGASVTLNKTHVGLSKVDNMSVAEILTNSALTGVPTAPTVAVSDNSNKIATTAFVKLLAYLDGNSTIDGGTF